MPSISSSVPVSPAPAAVSSESQPAQGAEDRTALLTRNRKGAFGATLARLELPVLLKVAGEDKQVGDDTVRVLSRERLQEFYDGTLFYDIAAENAA